jgi:hypothetical protein
MYVEQIENLKRSKIVTKGLPCTKRLKRAISTRLNLELDV